MQQETKDAALDQMSQLHAKLVALNAAALALEDYIATDWDEASHETLVEALGDNLSVDKDEFQTWIEKVVSESQDFLDSSEKAQREANQAPVDAEEDEDGDAEAS